MGGDPKAGVAHVHLQALELQAFCRVEVPGSNDTFHVVVSPAPRLALQVEIYRGGTAAAVRLDTAFPPAVEVLQGLEGRAAAVLRRRLPDRPAARIAAERFEGSGLSRAAPPVLAVDGKNFLELLREAVQVDRRVLQPLQECCLGLAVGPLRDAAG